jgi:hypothetical protein
MADDLREFIEAELAVMLRDIGTDTESEYFTKRALEWIEKNAADFRGQWDTRKRNIVAMRKQATQNVYDVA